ncbi:TetR/AcrR family transcriptional regulator [Pseudomonas paraeruginosa]|uniref:TetR/AcrR family transcriptional regulator n=1 Tax=Pseudomonas aeruginosa group TaxID=136841 RepID=UPI00071BFE8A|nr:MULTISPECIES: TetR/AcrR family transcriptional regulator [Pseudomonas aeruginosa group]KSF68852.1 TetR family transcriptional regulator [Pseudomonas aeruginosa]PTC34021.1 TetR family transcriptional regulator [Pseudomonas aeruginosa]
MRYPEDHKQKTRQRIVEEAARLFRQDGVGATGLQPLMKALGLTHGGFYAHFKSKDDLVETALQHAAAQLKEATAPLADSERPLAALIGLYLSPRHRDDPGAGCPLPTLSAELGQRGTPSPTSDAIVRDRLELIESALPGEDAGERSVLLLAALVGALQLSRSVQDEALSQRILAATRRKLLEQVESSNGG